MRPARKGLLAKMMQRCRIHRRPVLTKPLNTGEMNQEATIRPSVPQRRPCVPRATKLKPIVDPTMLWVPEIGSFRNVATNSQTALLDNAAKQPSINSISLSSYMDTSRMPLRIVSDTL